MKKFISIMLCVCICLSCTVFSFADGWTSSDSTTLSNIYRYMPTSSQITTISNTLSTISTRANNIYNALVDIKGYLYDNVAGSVATILRNINSWLSPIYNAVVESPVELRILEGLLGYPTTDEGTGVTTWNSYLRNLVEGTVNAPSYTFSMNNNAGGYIDTFTLSASTNPIKDLSNYAYWFLWTQMTINNKMVDFDNHVTYGYNGQQTAVNWLDLSNSSFTPTSMTNGLYSWLSNIQAPVARLSYVLASDERIEAQEKAADNEQAVVDNFIDSSGSGTASTSDFSSVSDLSSGFKNNIATDANVSGIWNIFNSDNFGWFSQETANQLDTTGSGTRTLRSSGYYPTPLLDQQTEDIIKILGGSDND